MSDTYFARRFQLARIIPIATGKPGNLRQLTIARLPTNHKIRRYLGNEDHIVGPHSFTSTIWVVSYLSPCVGVEVVRLGLEVDWTPSADGQKPILREPVVVGVLRVKKVALLLFLRN